MTSDNDALHCRALVRAHARTFWLASQLLPARKRRAAYAVYAFCRVADDLADKPRAGVEPAAALARLRSDLDLAISGQASGPIFRELRHAMATFAIPAPLLHELLDGVARDLGTVEPKTWPELETYCQGVASSVGEMCTCIFGVEDDSDAALREARTRARTLGVAMQLTNILRDIGEDAANGRCYLPTEDLASFGLTRFDVLSAHIGHDPRWRALMAFQVERARQLYASSVPAIGLLSPDAQRCARACASGYAAILDAIETLRYDTFRRRASLSHVARAAVLWNAWRAPVGAGQPRTTLRT